MHEKATHPAEGYRPRTPRPLEQDVRLRSGDQVVLPRDCLMIVPATPWRVLYTMRLGARRASLLVASTSAARTGSSPRSLLATAAPLGAVEDVPPESVLTGEASHRR